MFTRYKTVLLFFTMTESEADSFSLSRCRRPAACKLLICSRVLKTLVKKKKKTLVKLELKFELRTTEFRIPLVRTYE
jgi:hypothetical protein